MEPSYHTIDEDRLYCSQRIHNTVRELESCSEARDAFGALQRLAVYLNDRLVRSSGPEGYYLKLTHHRPEFDTHAQRLADEHRRVLTQISGLLGHVPLNGDSEPFLASIVEVIKDVRALETAENTLAMDVIMRDEGVAGA